MVKILHGAEEGLKEAFASTVGKKSFACGLSQEGVAGG